MSWGIWMRWHVAGRIPASNMYESLLFLGWGVGLFALVATVFLRNRIVILNAAAGSAVTMALTDLLPIDRFVHPMPPVLSGTYWLAIHVPIIMVGYAVLALGVVVAHMQIGAQAFVPSRRSRALRMADLQYWYIHVGSILLVTGILTGSMWAASSWGRYWGWDPKEVWSLVAFLAYMAILHARAERLISDFGVAAWSDRRLPDDPDDVPRGELRPRLGPPLLRLRRLERRPVDAGRGPRRGGLRRRGVGEEPAAAPSLTPPTAPPPSRAPSPPRRCPRGRGPGPARPGTPRGSRRGRGGAP